MRMISLECKAILISLAGFGLFIEDFYESKTDGSILFHVTVPEHSTFRDVNNNEMSDIRLANRFKKCMEDMLHKKVRVKYKVVEGQHFDEDMRKSCENRMLDYLKWF